MPKYIHLPADHPTGISPQESYPCRRWRALRISTAFTERFTQSHSRLPRPQRPSSQKRRLQADEDDLMKTFSEFDLVMDLNIEENQELLVEFHTEAVDHLRQIEEAVLELEQDVTNCDPINSMFRSFHTIKGVAGFLNLIPVNRLAHEIESLVDLVRNEELSVFTGIIDLVLENKDTITQ